MRIGDRIRAVREQQKISRKDLAQYAGIGVSTLSDLELGRSQNTTALHKIATRLGVAVEYLETGKGDLGPTTGKQAWESSHPVGLDATRLASALTLVEGAIADSKKRIPHAMKATMLARVYAMPELNEESAPAVRAALAGILDSLGDE